MSARLPGYLVRYGAAGLLGYFLPESAAACFARGVRVIVRSDRGWEAGTVLGESEPPTFPNGVNPEPGLILGVAGPEDDARLEHLRQRADGFFAEARERLGARPVELVDVEMVGEPERLIVHLIRFGAIDLEQVRSVLAVRTGEGLDLLDVTSPHALEDAGCGDCGGGCSEKKDGAGCSGGTCGSGCGSKKEFDSQWKAYFAELREKMHAGLASAPLARRG